MKDKKTQFVMLIGHLLQNQWVIFLVFVGFERIKHAQHMYILLLCTTPYLGCSLLASHQGLAGEDFSMAEH